METSDSNSAAVLSSLKVEANSCADTDSTSRVPPVVVATVDKAEAGCRAVNSPLSSPFSTMHPAADPLFHWVWLWLAAGVLVAACVLRVEGGDQVTLPFLGQPLPGMCTYKRWLGMDCPGCGLTRCFVSMAHADFSAAWSFNPAGIALFALVAVQLPWRGAQIWRIQRGAPEFRLGWLSPVALWTCLGAILLQWVVRMVG